MLTSVNPGVVGTCDKCICSAHSVYIADGMTIFTTELGKFKPPFSSSTSIINIYLGSQCRLTKPQCFHAPINA